MPLPRRPLRPHLQLRPHQRRPGDAGRGLFSQGKRWWLRLHEKGGKHHEMPVHHTLEEYLDTYIREAGIGEDKKGPLFRSALVKNGRLSDHQLDRINAILMIKRRARAAGIETQIGNHSFRATGITI